MNNVNKITIKDVPTNNLGKFAKNPYYFLSCFAFSIFFFIAADYVLIIQGRLKPFDVSFSLFHFLLIPLGIVAGGMSAIFIHNAAHGCFGPKWLNRLIGEIAGTQQLYGFLGWKTAHILHHIYPDDPRKDPHAPMDLTFRQYAVTMPFRLTSKVTQYYFVIWGEGRKYKIIWKLNSFCGFWGLWSRLIFWYLILGHSGFLFFFIPSYIFNNFIFPHLNYYTHRPYKNEQEKFEILNLNHNLYYKVANAIFFGIYYHKNHHLDSSFFNPKS